MAVKSLSFQPGCSLYLGSTNDLVICRYDYDD